MFKWMEYTYQCHHRGDVKSPQWRGEEGGVGGGGGEG